MLNRLNDQEVDVLVAGAGPVGLCHALWLQQRSAEPVVIEPRSSPRRDEWCVLGTHALGLLEQLDVLDTAEPALIRYRGVAAYRGRSESARPEALDDSDAELALVRRSDLENVLEEAAVARSIPVYRGHRLQKLQIWRTHSIAEVQKLEKVSAGYAGSHMESVVSASQEVTALRVIGADGRRSVVRRDLGVRYAQFAAPRVASACLVELESPPDRPDWVRVVRSVGSVDLLWPLDAKRLLWITEWAPDTVPTGVELDTQISLSVDPIQRGQLGDSYLEQGAERASLDIAEVKHRHALRFQPTRATPAGIGPIWVSGAAAQVVNPLLGTDDAMGLHEVRDLALLLGFGSDGATNQPSLTPSQYEQRRLTLQQRALDPTATLEVRADTRRRIDPVLPLVGLYPS